MLIDSIVIMLGAKIDKAQIIDYLMLVSGANVCFSPNNFWKNTSATSHLKDLVEY
jgi:hypothetical protein